MLFQEEFEMKIELRTMDELKIVFREAGQGDELRIVFRGAWQGDELSDM